MTERERIEYEREKGIYPAIIPDTHDLVYKVAGGVELKLWFFYPWKHDTLLPDGPLSGIFGFLQRVGKVTRHQ